MTSSMSGQGGLQNIVASPVVSVRVDVASFARGDVTQSEERARFSGLRQGRRQTLMGGEKAARSRTRSACRFVPVFMKTLARCV